MLIRRAGVIGISAAGGQLIQVLALALLARQLRIEEIAAYGFFMAIVAVTSAAGAFRYEVALGVVDSDSEFSDIMSAVLSLSLAIGLLTFLAHFAIATFQTGAEHGSPWTPGFASALAGAMATFSTILLEALPILLLRRGRELPLYVLQVTRPLLVSVIQLGLYFAAGFHGYSALIWGVAIGQVAAVALCFASAGEPVRRIIRSVSVRGTLQALRTHRVLATGQALQQVFSRISLNALPLFLTWAFPASYGGWYVVASRILAAPGQTIGKAVRNPVLSAAGDHRDDPARLRTLHVQATLGMTVVSIVLFSPLVIWPKEIISVLIGADWAAASDFLRIISLIWWSSFLNIPSSSLVPALKLNQWYARVELIHFLLRLILIFILGLLLARPLMMALAVGLCAVAFNAYIIWFVGRATLIGGRSSYKSRS